MRTSPDVEGRLAPAMRGIVTQPGAQFLFGDPEARFGPSMPSHAMVEFRFNM